jgi:hypothetical protein
MNIREQYTKIKILSFCEIFLFLLRAKYNVLYFNLKIYTLIGYNILYLYIFFQNFLKL